MITEQEHKRIYSIVDEFGGDQKETLRSKLINLLQRHDRALIIQINKAIENLS